MYKHTVGQNVEFLNVKPVGIYIYIYVCNKTLGLKGFRSILSPITICFLQTSVLQQIRKTKLGVSLLLLPLAPFVIQVSSPHGHFLSSSLTKIIYALLIAILHSISLMQQIRNLTVPRTFFFFLSTESREEHSEPTHISFLIYVTVIFAASPKCILSFSHLRSSYYRAICSQDKKSYLIFPEFIYMKAIIQNSLKVYKLIS